MASRLRAYPLGTLLLFIMILFPCHSFRQAFFWLDNSSNWSLGFLFNRPWLSVRILYGWRKIADHTRRSKRGGFFLRRSYTCHWVLPTGPSALGWLLTKPAAMTRDATKYSEVPVKSYQRTVDFQLGDGEPVARQQRAIEQWDQRSPIGSCSTCTTSSWFFRLLSHKKGFCWSALHLALHMRWFQKCFFFFQILSSCVTRASQ